MLKPEASSSYDPLNDPEYMSAEMLLYFKDKLMQMHNEMLEREKLISLSLLDAPNQEPDLVDRGVNEELRIEPFSYLEHEDQLRHEVESALQRMNEGTYGYCEETGAPIGVKRLLAVPYARYSLKIQKYKEDQKKRLRKA